jgi:hypothetical protein
MKPRTKKQKFADNFVAWKCVKEGRKVERQTRKDGSLPTRPTITCPDLPESEVLQQCLAWLHGQRIFCDRLNNGVGDFHGTGQIYTYGIVGGGDILGVLPGGKHFEVECKRGSGGSFSKDQQDRLRGVTGAGGLYIVVHGLPELIALISPYIKHEEFGI